MAIMAILHMLQMFSPQLRLSFFLLLFFIPVTLLDAFSTLVAVNELGYKEINPLTNTESLQSILIPEYITALVFVGMVFLGWKFCKQELKDAFYAPYPEFEKCFWARRHTVINLILILPFAIAILRIEAVINNLMIVQWGWSPSLLFCAVFMLLTGLSEFLARFVLQILLFITFHKLIGRFIWWIVHSW